MKIIAYLERPASDDPDTRNHELWHADRICRLNGRVMIALEVGWLATLVHNLAIGGALCRTYQSGYVIGGANPQERDWWKPGCGRAAP